MDGQGNAFFIAGRERPVLRLYRGVTYRFFLNDAESSAQPFFFSTQSETVGDGTYEGEYLSGVTGSRSTFGSVEISVGADTPSTLYYHSGSASGVGGRIHVVDSEGLITSPSANPVTFNVAGDIAIEATYAEGSTEHALSLVAVPGSGGTVSGAGTYAHGSEVQIQALPSVGYYFAGWSGGVPADAKTASTTYVLGDSTILSASFLLNQITLDSGQDGWTYSTWLGFYKRESSGWVFSLSHGWIYPVGDSDESIYFQSDSGDWFWTSSSRYPYLYSYDRNGWMYYSSDDSTPESAYFFDYGSNDWVVFKPISFTPR